MCGIIGFSGKNGQNFNIEKIKILFLYNESRGEDSCGIWSPKNKIVKVLGKASEKIVLNNDLVVDKLLIGHTKKGSFGYSKTINTSHPFESEKTVYVHNGTLTDVYATGRIFDMEYSQITVDSLLIGKAFDKYDCDPKLAMGCLSGVANILMNIKSSENSLFVYKHKERPLFRGDSEEGMYISSIEDSLKAIGCTKIKEFSDGYWYEINDGKIANHLVVKMKEYVSTTRTSGNVNTYYSDLPKNGSWVKLKPGVNYKGVSPNLYYKSTVSYDNKELKHFLSLGSNPEKYLAEDFVMLPGPSKGDCAYVMGEKAGLFETFRKVIIIGNLPIKPYVLSDKCMCIDFDKIKEINSVSEITKDFIEEIPAFDLSPMSPKEIKDQNILTEYDISEVQNVFKNYYKHNSWPIKTNETLPEIVHKYKSGQVVLYANNEYTITSCTVESNKPAYHLLGADKSIKSFVREDLVTLVDLDESNKEKLSVEVSNLSNMIDDLIAIESDIKSVIETYYVMETDSKNITTTLNKLKYKLLIYGKNIIKEKAN